MCVYMHANEKVVSMQIDIPTYFKMGIYPKENQLFHMLITLTDKTT